MDKFMEDRDTEDVIRILEAARGLCIRRAAESRWDEVAAIALGEVLERRRAGSGVFQDIMPPVYQASPRARPEAEAEPRGRRPPAQGYLVPPGPANSWGLLFRSCREHVTGEEIAALLNMDLSTFHARREQGHFPPPALVGRKGRGYAHTWYTRDVLTYLNHYSDRGLVPPIFPERLHREAARQRTRKHKR